AAAQPLWVEREKRRRPSSQKPLVVIKAEPRRPTWLAAGRKHLVEVDDRLHRLELAEEKPSQAVVAPPVGEQLFSDSRGALISKRPPSLHVTPQGIDQRQLVTVFL